MAKTEWKWRGIHWATPVLTIGSLAAGIAVAIAHHVFYAFLDGSKAPTAELHLLGFRYAEQQLNLTVGNALAFLCKSFLAISLSSAFCQAFWRLAKSHARAKSRHTLGRIDTAFSADTNILALVHIPMWYHYPMLFAIALVIWIIPIATIFPPATLNVVVRAAPPSTTMVHTPSVDFANLNFVASMPALTDLIGEGPYYYSYSGPSQHAKQIAIAVAAQSAILPITPPNWNSSWDLTFYGPSIRCDEQPLGATMMANLAQYHSRDQHCDSPAAYMSWFPRPIQTFDYELDRITHVSLDPLPYLQAGANATAEFPGAPDAIFRRRGRHGGYEGHVTPKARRIVSLALTATIEC